MLSYNPLPPLRGASLPRTRMAPVTLIREDRG